MKSGFDDYYARGFEKQLVIDFPPGSLAFNATLIHDWAGLQQKHSQYLVATPRTNCDTQSAVFHRDARRTHRVLLPTNMSTASAAAGNGKRVNGIHCIANGHPIYECSWT